MLFRKKNPKETELLSKLEYLVNLPQKTNITELDQVLREGFYSLPTSPNKHYVNCFFTSKDLPNHMETPRNNLAGYITYTKRILMCLYRHNTGQDDYYLDDEYLYEDGTYFSEWDHNKRSKIENIMARSKESFSKREYRVDRLKAATKVVHKAINFFSSQWEFRLQIDGGRDCLYSTFSHLPSREAKEKSIKRLKEKSLPLIQKGQKNITSIIRYIMVQEIPRMETLEEILEILTRIEQDRKDQFEALKEDYEKKLAQALKQQLEKVETKYKKLLIEVHENMAKIQSMIEKTYQQNELLLASQKDQVKGYENQLFGLLEKLKNE